MVERGRSWLFMLESGGFTLHLKIRRRVCCLSQRHKHNSKMDFNMKIACGQVEARYHTEIIIMWRLDGDLISRREIMNLERGDSRFNTRISAYSDKVIQLYQRNTDICKTSKFWDSSLNVSCRVGGNGRLIRRLLSQSEGTFHSAHI